MGGGGRLLSVSVFRSTSVEKLDSDPIVEDGLHQFTLGTCGSCPSEARQREAWARLGLPPFPSGRGGGGVTDIRTMIGFLCPSIRLAVIRARSVTLE